MDKYYQLYSSLEGFRRVGNSDNQYIALCPYHQDSKPSFSINTEKGVWNCKACGKSGNAYQYAQDIGHHNPKEYISDMNGYNGTKYTKYTSNHKESGVLATRSVDNANLSSKMEAYKLNLKNNWESMDCSKIWSKSIIDELDVGLDSYNNFVFAYHNEEGKIINIKKHKGGQEGEASKKWYLSHKIASYKRDRELFICEGEKDAICLYNEGYQVTSGSCGALSIPNVDELKEFKTIWVVYDKDNTGIDGAKKLSKELLSNNLEAEIMVVEWDESLSDKYDVYDAFIDDIEKEGKMPTNLKEALTRTRPLELDKVIKEQVQGFEVLNIGEFLNMKYEKTERVIQYIVDKNQVALIGGDTGCKKSWVALQSMLSVASGVPLFDEYETLQMPTMLVQFENENFDIQERLKTMLPYFVQKVGNSNWTSNLNVVPMKVDSEIFIDNWNMIEKTIAYNNFQDGLLIVDNMYTSTEKEIQNNNELKELLQTITNIRRRYNLTILLVCHTNKHNADGQQKDLNGEQLQGGKTLLNNVANVTMLHQSTLSIDLGIMKITKGGRSARNELLNVPMRLHCDNDNCILRKGRIVNNIVPHFQSAKEKYEFGLVRDLMTCEEMMHNSTFDREMLIRNLPKEYHNVPKNTITRLIDKLRVFGLVKKLRHNTYEIVKETLEEVDESNFQ